MTDQSVEVVGRPAGVGRVAQVVTDVFAPQYVAIVMPPLAGLLVEGWAGLAWGLLAAAVCAGVPAAVIAVGVRRGRLDSMHLVERKSRKGPMLAGFAAVVAGLAVLVLAEAPVVVASAAVMLGWVLVMGPITLAWKISFHTAVSAGTIERVLEINQLTTVTKEVVEAARENLIIGVM